MKKPRDKYKKEIKFDQIISIKKHKRFIFVKLKVFSNNRQPHPRNFTI